MLEGIFEEGYGIIPKKLMRDPNLSMKAKAVCAYFLSYTGAGKITCWPSYQRMAEELQVSKGTISSAINELEENGIIQKSKHSKNPLNHQNEYKLLILDTRQYLERTTDGTPFVLTTVQGRYENNNNINNNINNNNIYTVYDFWNTQRIIVHKKLTDKIKRKITTILKDYSLKETNGAIANYSKVLLGDEYYWTYRWTLVEFLQRGIDKFVDEARPLENFRKNKGKQDQTIDLDKIKRELEAENAREN
jgi:DNA-binding Lrp family transcriptional regulator